MAFRGTRRFELIRKLGEGGMGLVYEAHDNERDMRVALKTLRELDASSLYRFKREFRVLNDVSHPNIVGFYDLVSEGNDWFFTMELVEGVDFIKHLRPPGWLSSSEMVIGDDTDDTAVIAPRPDVAAAGGLPTLEGAARPRVPIASVCDLAKLRPTLAQLAEALQALHGAGMVHRDLKPSNVRVTARGRVVLVDFGIAAAESLMGDPDGGVAGTPAFMAPEQAAGEGPSAPADWYSFGVMLYLALTGQLPFVGVPELALMAKQSQTPARPSQLVEGVPPDLDALCMALLEPNPQKRPSGPTVLQKLGVDGDDPLVTESPESSRAVFVGRERELAELTEAFRRAASGQTVGMFVRGVSGMGKSTLVRRFLDEISVDAKQPIVLKGRCHERESLPYKAFDGVIDHLSHLLLGLPAERVQSLLPDEVDLLPRLFPVLRRVPGIQRAHPLGVPDPQELRARAFAALSSLFSNLARWRPLVVYIDDLQWADRDSLQLLVELMRDPEPRPMLFLGAMRAENLATDGLLNRVLAALAARQACREIEVGPLSATEQRALVSRLLGASTALSDEFWAESAGSPLFLSELVRYARERGDANLDGKPTLEDVLYRRIERLPASARALLEAVAVAGEPLPLWLLGATSGLSGEELERALAMLRVSSLVRVARSGREPWPTAYHDRVRETLQDRLPKERLRQLHQHLAEALERWEDATVDALARHWLAAGDRTQASAYLVKAARAATEKLAFDRAAELYRAALDAGDHPADRARELWSARGAALTLAGRSFEAAEAYRTAAQSAADPDERAELTRRAADNLLRSGHIEKGIAALRDVMSQIGIRVAESTRKALGPLLVQRALIALRGYKFKPRRASEVAPRERARIETLYAASTALGMIDHVRGADLQTRHLRAALDVGDERCALRALAVEAVFQAAQGGRHLRIAEKIARDTELKAHRIGDPELIAMSQLAVGAHQFFSGNYRGTAIAFERAERIYSTECNGMEWERKTASFFALQARINMGELADAGRLTERLLDEADRRNDLYAGSLFKTHPNTWRLLARDQPDEALAQLNAALDGWPRDAFYMAHFLEMISRATILLYVGDAAGALQHLRAQWLPFKRSMLASLPWVLAEYQRYFIRAAYAVGELDAIKPHLRTLESLPAKLTQGYVSLYRGALAHRRGDAETSQRLLHRAEHLFHESDTPQLAAGARHELGKLLGGSEGTKMQSDAVTSLATRGVANPARMIALLVPIFEPPASSPSTVTS